jgi:hypothetical protein
MTAPSKSKSKGTPLPPLEPPPAYLRKVPDQIIAPAKGARGRNDLHRRLIAFLRSRRITATPTLYEIEAERARRGMNNLSVWSGSPLPLPYPKREPVPMRAPLNLDDLRARARHNRERLAAHGLSPAEATTEEWLDLHRHLREDVAA